MPLVSLAPRVASVTRDWSEDEVELEICARIYAWHAWGGMSQWCNRLPLRSSVAVLALARVEYTE